MPCYYTGSAEGDLRLAAEEREKTMTQLTQLLCKSCKELSKYAFMQHWPEDLRKWYSNHKKVDAERKRKEKSNVNRGR